MKAWRAALAVSAIALSCAYPDIPAVQAQSVMRTPNLNIQPRIPTINPTVTPRIDPNVAGRTVTGVDRGRPDVTMRATPRIGVTSTLPNARYSPNLSSACSYAYRASSGECQGKPVSSADGGGAGKSTKNGKNGGASRNTPLAALNPSTIPGEFVAEIDGSLSDVQADALARRYGLVHVESQNFPLIGAIIGLFRITDRRPVETVRRAFAGAAGVRSVQLNFRFLLQDRKTVLTEGDPAQYALAKLRLPQAHALASGANVTIAVIDSGIDERHPELLNAVADNFDALGSKEGPHVHGTGIAGAIVSHARLMGSAPQARILGIRAFGVAQNGAESTTFVILKALNYAALHGAQIINMSFAGPKDPLIERGINATAARDIVMVAASGNAGPKSPPLFPAANSNVIAVSATDAHDKLFAASNRGSHIAVAAPGVDIFLPAPDEKYQMSSGTSFSAAYVSGLVALMLERNPALKPGEVRAILIKTARDLGSPGRDDQFGAGEADAFAAVSAASAPAVPVASASPPPATEKVPDRQEIPATRALDQPAAAMASDK
ncbi:S8 family serine peptidase [Bradyrhizobium sediminis]|uniref:S8 family serine peptidase n=2 Tax=Bradyrhizobium sediminis TaxID=2840469 RepID=A0A975RPU6_9BRAD|nr:S8 family serine peptidase [Bradyrhizobium sediminis]